MKIRPMTRFHTSLQSGPVSSHSCVVGLQCIRRCITVYCIVVRPLRGRIAEPDKKTLLDNGRETRKL
jgi:hypothetical protein